MKKLLFLLFVSYLSYAQKDSLTILQADWKTENLGSGITWKYKHFSNKELFEGNQSINIIETKLKNRKINFNIAVADTMANGKLTNRKLIPTSQLAQQKDALVAVNAGFFDMKNGGSVDFVKVSGTITDTTRINGVTRLPFHSISAITIHKNKVKIIKGTQQLGWEKALNEENVLLTGPLLIYEGKKQVLAKTPFNDNRHPRTCACITKDKKLLLITVDGRASEAYGMTLHELTILASTLNCKDAINFDGGGSTTMYLKGKPENGVVNFPSDNKLFDHAGERKVANIFFLSK